MILNLTIEQAMQKIEELENENAELKKKLEKYENRDYGGRRKHDAKWQASFNAFSELYEKGMSIVEIVEQSELSKRTCYRYKAYYDALRKSQEGRE